MGFATFCGTCSHNNCKDVQLGWGAVVGVGNLRRAQVDMDVLLLQGSRRTLGVANASRYVPALTIFRQLAPANCWAQLVIVAMR